MAGTPRSCRYGVGHVDGLGVYHPVTGSAVLYAAGQGFAPEGRPLTHSEALAIANRLAYAPAEPGVLVIYDFGLPPDVLGPLGEPWYPVRLGPPDIDPDVPSPGLDVLDLEVDFRRARCARCHSRGRGARWGRRRRLAGDRQPVVGLTTTRMTRP